MGIEITIDHMAHFNLAPAEFVRQYYEKNGLKEGKSLKGYQFSSAFKIAGKGVLSTVLKGYAGKIVKVNLSDRFICRLDSDEYASNFLGGRGIAAKIYWDEVHSTISPFAPENYLIFVTGPLAGFLRLGGCRWQICGKSPLVEPGFFSCANLGGSWGAWLKYAGYDALVVTGRSEKPVYIYVEGPNIVEVREASHLWGKTTKETESLLYSELGGDIKVLTIGPAGENLVRFATVLASDNAVGTGGFGGVMGAKRLKAVVLRVLEKERPAPADPDRLRILARKVHELHSGNLEEKEYKTLIGHKTACYGCIGGCPRRTYETEDGKKFKSFCQATLVYLEKAMKYSPKNGLNIAHFGTRLCDEYGLDTAVMEPMIYWLDLCYQQGLISESETELPLSNMGSAEFIGVLVRKTSHRDGFGELLAEGTVKAAQRLGRNATGLISKAKIATRGGETLDYDPRLILPNSLIYATEPRRPIQLLHSTAFPLMRWINWYNSSESAHLSTEVFNRIAELYWGSHAAADFSTYEGKALAAKKIQDYGYAKESLILCDRIWPIYQVCVVDHDLMKCGRLESSIVSAITGQGVDENDLLKMGEKIFNLQRLILLREGWNGRSDDRLLDYLHEEPLESVYFSPDCIVPFKGGSVGSKKGSVLSKGEFERLKDEYYSLRGWDIGSGLPTLKKLQELGLSGVAKVSPPRLK